MWIYISNKRLLNLNVEKGLDKLCKFLTVYQGAIFDETRSLKKTEKRVYLYTPYPLRQAGEQLNCISIFKQYLLAPLLYSTVDSFKKSIKGFYWTSKTFYSIFHAFLWKTKFSKCLSFRVYLINESTNIICS